MPDVSLISMSLAGWRELEQALKELGEDKDIKATMRKALKNVAEPAASYARSLAPKGATGKYAARITVSTQLTRRQRRGRKKPGPLEAEVYFGPQGSSQGHLLEFGTGPRRQKNGKSTGAVPPQPHMRPAWENFKHEMLEKFGAELGKQIERSAKRIARKQAKLIRQGKKP